MQIKMRMREGRRGREGNVPIVALSLSTQGNK